MNALPSAIKNYLRDNVTELFYPACLEVDSEHNLRNKYGELGFYQLDKLDIDDNLDNMLPVLIGISCQDAPMVLPLVRIGNGSCCNIHLLPAAADSFYLLLLDAKSEHDSIEVYQQKSNEVQLLNARLKKVLAELNQAQHELREKNQQIAQVSLLKSQFIANISHEFRTPLTSILGYTDMFAAKKIDASNIEQVLRAIGSGAQHVLSLVDNVLDYARFEAGELSANAHSTDLDRLFADITSIFIPIAAEKQLSFTLSNSGLGFASVDAVRLRQVVINLCANAIKYTDKGSVSLDVRLDDELLRIAVADTGAGIPVAAQERIFLPFRRLDRDRLSKGAGLGLAISQQILEMLGGGLTLDSKPGAGSIFSVTIPVIPLPEPSPAQRQTIDANISILIADDDADVRNIMQLYLQNQPYQVHFVSDGREAVEFALKNQPRLVLMDMYMPILDGISATAQLRAEGFIAPIIMLSAAVSHSDKAHALSVGCNGYLLKPLVSDMLIAEINSLLQNP